MRFADPNASMQQSARPHSAAPTRQPNDDSSSSTASITDDDDVPPPPFKRQQSTTSGILREGDTSRAERIAVMCAGCAVDAIYEAAPSLSAQEAAQGVVC